MIACLLAFMVLAGCPTDSDDDGGNSAKRLFSGKVSGSTRIPRNIQGAGRSIFRDLVLPDEVKNEPFVLDTDPDTPAPAGMTALKGKVLAEGDSGPVVILLEGLLDNESGKFVAAGIDSETLGIGFQIEGFFKNDSVSDIKVTVKVKNMETLEWEEMEITPPESATEVTATETTDQVAGLPSEWSGKYAVPEGAITSESENMNALLTQIQPYLFFIVTPVGLATVADYDRIDAEVRTMIRAMAPETTEEQVNGAIAAVHAEIDIVITPLSFSFLEVEGQPDGSYHALVFIKDFDVEENGAITVTGELFSKLRLTRAPNGDITLAVGHYETENNAASTAAAARAATNFNPETFTLKK
jgi:hypothetical protein